MLPFIRKYIISAILGSIGARVGFVLGSGIEDTWQGTLIAIFLSFMFVALVFSWISNLTSLHLRGMLLGTVWGISAEFSGLDSWFLVFLIGLVVGVVEDYSTETIGPLIKENKDKYLPILQLILGIIVFGSVLTALIWAYPRGLLKDVAQVSLLLAIPALIIAALAFAGMITGWTKKRKLKSNQVADSPKKHHIEGGLYAKLNNDESGYNIIKILKIDQYGYHIRIFSNRFLSIPEHIIFDNLFMVGFDDKGTDQELGMGHVPVLKENFEKWTLCFIQHDPVRSEELEGYFLWQESQGGYFH